MSEERRSPNLPWWVAWCTTDDTTRKSLRHDAWWNVVLGAGVLVACAAAIFGGWSQAAWAGIVPGAVLLVMGLWMLAAVSWLERNRAWERIASGAAGPRSSRVGGTVIFLVGLLLLTLAGWRFWACFLGPDDSLLWRSEPFVEESRHLLREHRERVEDIKARGALKEEYPGELERYESAEGVLRLRREAALQTAVSRWRWLEGGTASLTLLFGLLLCVGGYRQSRGVTKEGAPVPDSTTR